MGGKLIGIDLRADEHKEVVRLLQRHLPNTEVWAYGSRVKGTARPASDLDLVTFASAGRQEAVSRLREAFDESSLPFRVDLFVWDKVPKGFRRDIEGVQVVVQKEKTGCKLPEGWQETTLGKFCPFSYGKNLPKKVRDNLGKVPVFGSNGVVGHHSKPLIQDRGIIIGRKGTVGTVTFSSIPFWPIDTTFYISEDSRRDLRYTFYLLKSLRMEHMNTDSAVPGLNRNAAHAREITIPPLPKQKAIAHILGSLDDRIELNRRMNETLEAMARAIFKDWFVDFGPIRAKAEGRAPYLTSEIWDIFPDALNDEDKPVGWQIGSIGDLADTNHQSWTVRNHPVAVEYVDLSNAKWGNIDAVTTLAWEDTPSRARRVARMGDTIVGTTRPGNGSFVYISQNGLTVSTGFAVLSPREMIYRDFVYIAATRLDNMERLANLADGHGGAYPAVKPKEVSDTELVLPGDAVLSAFADLVSPLRAKIENVKVESRSLSQTRDLLVPKLMSGEIRLREAERAVEVVI